MPSGPFFISSPLAASVALARLPPFEPAFCCEVFLQMNNTFGPVRSSLVTKASNLVVPDDDGFTLSRAKPARKRARSVSVLRAPTHPNLTLQHRQWKHVASCPETLLRAAGG